MQELQSEPVGDDEVSDNPHVPRADILMVSQNKTRLPISLQLHTLIG